MKFTQEKLKRLCPAVRSARLSLERFRQNQTDMVRQYVGAWWSEDGARQDVPVNLISLYVGTAIRSLVAKTPRAMYTTHDPKYRPTVNTAQQWVNQELERQGVGYTLQDMVLSYLFTLGIGKVALAAPQDAAQKHWNLKAGHPFFSVVAFEDFAFDITCRKFSEYTWAGHRMRVPLWSIRDSKLFSKERKKIEATPDRLYNETGDERVSVMQQGQYHRDEYEEMCEIWEFYLPADRLVVTLRADDGGLPLAEDEPLLEQEWVGPDCGPFHFLGSLPVPNNAMPKAPIQDLMDQHLAVNNLYRKLIRQAARQKQNLLYSAGADATAKAINDAMDGQTIKCDNPDRVKMAEWGGPNQQNLLFAENLWQLFSKHAGNLEMMAGLSPQSRTATQDEMLMKSASAQMSSMQQDVMKVTGSVYDAMGWYFWHHPELRMKSSYSPPGLPEVVVPREVGPDKRQLPWDQIDKRVDPYSLGPKTPEARLQTVFAVLKELAPFMQAAQAQGVGLNMPVLLKKIEEFTDMPDLSEILQAQEPAGEGQAQPEEPGMPQETTRNYTRRSVGADSQQAQAAERMNALAKQYGGQNGQPESNGAL